MADSTYEKAADAVETSLDNYTSFKEHAEDAEIEVERVVKAKFAARQKKRVVRRRFKTGTTSRMAILVKTKNDGSTKRRLILLAPQSLGVPKRWIEAALT